MEIKTIKTNITAVDKIFHISDIHIRTLKRHKEYQEVFDNLLNPKYDNMFVFGKQDVVKAINKNVS